jgi:hypothetical protein
VEALIIPGVLLLLLGLWGVFETGRKFRREFRRRGKTWEAACAALDQGQGRLIVDTLWGPQRGLGHPVIWWVPTLAEGEDLAAKIETMEGGAMLVRCPRRLRNLDALRTRFGPQNVVAHSWNVGTQTVPKGTEKP